MEFKVRNHKIAIEVLNGKTYAKIADENDFSTTRAREIFFKVVKNSMPDIKKTGRFGGLTKKDCLSNKMELIERILHRIKNDG